MMGLTLLETHSGGSLQPAVGHRGWRPVPGRFGACRRRASAVEGDAIAAIAPPPAIGVIGRVFVKARAYRKYFLQVKSLVFCSGANLLR